MNRNEWKGHMSPPVLLGIAFCLQFSPHQQMLLVDLNLQGLFTSCFLFGFSILSFTFFYKSMLPLVHYYRNKLCFGMSVCFYVSIFNCLLIKKSQRTSIVMQDLAKYKNNDCNNVKRNFVRFELRNFFLGGSCKFILNFGKTTIYHIISTTFDL